MKGEFLLEIGCEEIPARMVAEASESLRQLLEAELKAAGVLSKQGVQTYATPRRLVACCAELRGVEPDRVSQVVGPPRSVAFDASGKPTQAARSFAAKHKVRLASLKVVTTPKGEYVAAIKRIPGRPTRRVLGEMLPRVIPAIRFPRTMYWTSARGLRFIRPIRWLLALYAGQVVDFELAGVRSGRTTVGHPVLDGKQLKVQDFRDYRRRLRKAYVLVEGEQRARKIRREQKRLAASRRLRLPAVQAQSFSGDVQGINDLLENSVASTEYPSVIFGQFDLAFLTLPEEVLITVMAHHQKYFYLRDTRGRLAPYFLAVIDSDGDRTGVIRRNHERVLEARFRDAQFFWEADRRARLESRLPALAGVVFAEGLGTYEHKTRRLEQLAAWLADNVSVPGRRADREALQLAARLSKCDLTTQLVGEFPELQGIAGGLYAREEGEAEKVWRTIYEQYRPQRAFDPSPSTLEGALAAVADRVDTVVGCFRAGLLPSGSSDPRGLRRAGQGAVKIILDHRLRLDLRQLLTQAEGAQQAQALPAPLAPPGTKLQAMVWNFFLERARYVLGEFAFDELNAVFATGVSDLVDARDRLEALRRVRPSSDFEPLSVAFKRIRNILEQAGDGARWASRSVEPRLLDAGAERDLFDAFSQLRPRVADLRSRNEYAQALRLIASLRPQVDRFFDDVLVMTDNPALRDNRLALLAHILSEFSAIADFAEIIPTRPAAAARGKRAKKR